MLPAASGSITAFFLYDVAEAIDLAAVTGLVSATVPVLMAPKPQTPSYIAFKPPPISIDGRTVRQLHTLFIEVNEVTDKTENALKIAGDVYTARLFTLVAARLGSMTGKAACARS